MRFLKIKLITVALILALTPVAARAATEFVSIVDPDNASGTDYTSLSAWEAAVQSDLTAATTQMFSGAKTGTVADAATVYLCRSGVYQTHSGTAKHASATQILVTGITGAATEQANDVWYTNDTCNSAGYFTVTGSQAGGDSAIAVASARSSGTADTTAVTVDGWTTSATNYIKIWTDPTTGARHNGKWDDSKYRLQVNGTSNVTLIRIDEDYVRIEGVQFSLGTTNSESEAIGIYSAGAGDKDFQISSSIIRRTGGTADGAGIYSGQEAGSLKIWNNMIYDLGYGFFSYAAVSKYLYNNTFYGNANGIYTSGGEKIAKNNIVKGGNSNAYYGTFSSGTDYNATDGTDDIGTGSNNKISQTFSFVDEGNDDFHLSTSDTAAKNSGTNLQADSNLPFSQDIDNSYRGNAWDIGADEVATEFISTVMESGGNYSTLSSWEADVNSDLTAATTRVYSGSLTGSITDGATVTLYRGGASQSITATLVAKSASQILLSGISGTVPLNVVANDEWRVDASNLWTVTGTLDSLGASPIAVAKIDGAWTSADTTAVQVDGWTTGADNYVKIYTTTAARHSGKWDDSKYRIEVSDSTPIWNLEEYFRIDGLQIKLTATGAESALYLYGDNNGETWVSNSIVRGVISGTGETYGINRYGGSGATFKIWNNIIYDFINGSQNSTAIYNQSGTMYAYNNTAVNSYYGIFNDGTSLIAKNNIVKGSGNTNAYVGTFASGTDYNATDGTDSIGQGSNNKTSQTFAFVDEANDDFHLSLTDTAAKNSGTNLQADANLPFSQDIDGSYRGNAWDIGADEVPTEFVSTVMQSGGNYSTLSAWESDVNSDLTAATTRVYSGSLTGSITDGATVTLYRGGASQSITATLVAKSASQILLSGISGTVPLNVVANDEWRVDASNLWTVTGTLDSLGASPIAVAKIDGAWSAADTTAVTINDWTTSADNYIKIYTTAAARHNGSWDDSKYRIVTSNNSNVIYELESFIRIEGIQLQNTYAGVNSGISFNSGYYEDTPADVRVSNSLIWGGGTDPTIGIYVINISNGLAKIWNNIVYDWGDNGSAGAIQSDDTGSTVYVYNNSVIHNNIGFGIRDAGGSTTIAKNNLVKAGGNDFYGTFKTGSDYNASSDATNTGGANDKTSQTFVFVDEGNDDFHLASTDTAAKNAGVELLNDANLAFSDDIDGESRVGAGSGWDIGADEARSNPNPISINRGVNFKPGTTFKAPDAVGSSLAITNLTNNVSTSNPLTTASVSPAAGSVVYVSVAVAKSGNYGQGTLSISGSGLSWEQVDARFYSSRRTLFVWRGTGTPSGGALTITYTPVVDPSGEAFQEFQYSVDQVTGLDGTTPNDAPVSDVDSVGDSPLNLPDVGTPDAGDVVFSAFGFENAADNLALTGSITQHIYRSGGANVRSLIVGYEGGTPDETPGVTWTTGGNGAGGIAFILNVAN